MKWLLDNLIKASCSILHSHIVLSGNSISLLQTSVCYDPKRALHTVPSELEVKTSSLPGIGLGVFTTSYVEQGAIFGPYKGTFDHAGTKANLDYAYRVNKFKNIN